MPTPAIRILVVAVVAAVTAAGDIAISGAAAAQTTGAGPEGQSLTVSRTTELSPAGETVTVSGSGYDEDKGIYVAYCVDNGAGAMPTPCGGGADTSGSLGASHWISSNPPSYGDGLAVPYGSGGSFTVTVTVTPTIQDVACTVRTCAVVTRADHTRSADRSQDVRVPVSFATASAGSGSTGSGEPGTGGPGGGEPGTDEPGRGQTSPAPPGPDGVSVITAGPVPEGTPAPASEALEITRLSADDSAGRWWLVSTGSLLGLLLALFVAGRITRRRRRRSAAR